MPQQDDHLEDGDDLDNTLLELLPPDGSTLGNQAALEALVSRHRILSQRRHQK